MNYIRHLNAFFSFVRSDNRLACSHVSLYLALFQYWNYNRFQNPFPVNRENLMKLSKIGSKNTYHKCIKELHQTKYIDYQPSASKFLPVKISMCRLDIKEEEESKFTQLDLFEIPSPLERDSGRGPGGLSPKIDTATVPKSVPSSTENDTGTVPKMGPYIKLNTENKNVCNTLTENFNKNEKKKKQKVADRRVPKPVLDKIVKAQPPALHEVEIFFSENKYSKEEAMKFFLYNQGKGWMLGSKVPVHDWKAIAQKWMLTPLSPGRGARGEGRGAGGEVAEDIFQRFLSNQKIFTQILPDHFAELKLDLNSDTMNQAWKERKNQLSGSNQYSINHLLQAYESGNIRNELIQKDRSNLETLAKRIAVIKYFHQLKQQGCTTLPP